MSLLGPYTPRWCWSPHPGGLHRRWRRSWLPAIDSDAGQLAVSAVTEHEHLTVDVVLVRHSTYRMIAYLLLPRISRYAAKANRPT